MPHIAVLGCGGWGIALALAFHANGHVVTLWSPFADEVSLLRRHRGNEKLLPGVLIPPEISITQDLSAASSADLIILAVPSFAVRETAARLSGVLSANATVVNAAKGIEPHSFKRLSEVIAEELPSHDVAVLSGPSHAEEVSRGVPTSIVAASKCRRAAEYTQDLLMSRSLRVYVNPDVVGVELGGALKNIIALAAGICDGLALGDNTKAALMTRGLSEIARLGVAMGAESETFAGLTGIGDLIVTCTSSHSRNRRAGILIGQGIAPSEAVSRVGMVEGYLAARTACELAERYDVYMPITGQLCHVLYDGRDAKTAICELMERPKKRETEHNWLVV